MGGAHYHATARFSASGVAGGGTDNAVTTTTDVWLDRAGSYRIQQENDRDGGRQVVLYGRELAVALRYGRMIRRVAEEPEPTRLLEEALGDPWAAFELVASHAHVVVSGKELMGGAPASVVNLVLDDGGRKRANAASAQAAIAPLAGMRAWRNGLAVRSLSARLLLDDATGALVKADISATFAGRPTGGSGASKGSVSNPGGGATGPVDGAVEVHTVLSEIASTPPIQRPPAEELVLRQRTLPEQRELLRGLAGAGNASSVRGGASTGSPHGGRSHKR